VSCSVKRVRADEQTAYALGGPHESARHLTVSARSYALNPASLVRGATQRAHDRYSNRCWSVCSRAFRRVHVLGSAKGVEINGPTRPCATPVSTRTRVSARTQPHIARQLCIPVCQARQCRQKGSATSGPPATLKSAALVATVTSCSTPWLITEMGRFNAVFKKHRVRKPIHGTLGLQAAIDSNQPFCENRQAFPDTHIRSCCRRWRRRGPTTVAHSWLAKPGASLSRRNRPFKAAVPF
jgi:hypothetical protein